MKKSEISMFLLNVEHGRYLGHTHCGNSGGYGWAIVASLQFGSDDDLLDWDVRIGGVALLSKGFYATRWIAEHGNKMSCEDAAYFFPDLPIELYRG